MSFVFLPSLPWGIKTIYCKIRNCDKNTQNPWIRETDHLLLKKDQSEKHFALLAYTRFSQGQGDEGHM